MTFVRGTACFENDKILCGLNVGGGGNGRLKGTETAPNK